MKTFEQEALELLEKEGITDILIDEKIKLSDLMVKFALWFANEHDFS